jgi:hypothetical protein
MICPLKYGPTLGEREMTCDGKECAWWVPLVKPGPRGEKGACAIHYLGIFGIEKAGEPSLDSPLP